MILVVAVPFIIIALFVWGVLRLRRGRAAIQVALEQAGYEVVKMERRIVRQGPFLWTTSNSQIVYRVLVSERSGRQRTAWARWGRTWLPEPDKLDLKWDD
jgi:hypothetical protein